MPFDGRLLSGISVLAAVVEAGSFVRAGESLGLSQSGVSRAVARLEQRVGVRLLDRTPRAVVLTDEGRRFYEEVAPLLRGLEDAAIQAGGAVAEPRGRLRVKVDPYFSRLVLAPRIGEFLAAFPDLSLELSASIHPGDLVAEGFDIGVRMGEPEPSSLIARLLLRTRILTVASPGYIARRGRPATPQALADDGHTCILFRAPATGRPFEWEFHRDGQVLKVEVDGPLLLDDAATAIGACIAGQGVAQFTALGMGDWLADGRLVELFPDWSEELFPIYAYHPSRRMPPAKVRRFLDFVVAISTSADKARCVALPPA
ncbi:LysR family transcriptional regulator [Caulobacter sp. CCUG 60055]|nr:LysR family transcriptional regulator [Caulobacter sp. CCUG 60055]MBQ1542301.1 LysR family transcriptional regulator [Caulobacteraceae bacterium]MCI3180932.1 LysR family transcriptional regulator [Caulobacter sp. CCUG 60055]